MVVPQAFTHLRTRSDNVLLFDPVDSSWNLGGRPTSVRPPSYYIRGTGSMGSVIPPISSRSHAEKWCLPPLVFGSPMTLMLPQKVLRMAGLGRGWPVAEVLELPTSGFEPLAQILKDEPVGRQ